MSSRLRSATCKKQSEQQQHNQSESSTSSINADASSSRLVFGLSNRTNKVKHDQYAERRSSQLSPVSASSNKCQSKSMQENGNSSTVARSGNIKASKFGNFYKPKDLISDAKTELVKSEQQVVLAEPKTEPKAEPVKQPPTVRMQFHIPPPPTRQSNSLGKGSVVSYAKARIYERPANRQSTLQDSCSLLNSAHIPDSILSGFKPPKQVNVSKARERWEGGEPFAKSRSRHLLAGKRLLAGAGWSSTSLVASQQRALSGQQQASRLAADSGPVKILSRGSVLERVQHFEKVPANSDSNGLQEEPEASQELSCDNLQQSHRRLSLRRRSSALSLGQRSNSITPSIPKFYHPNGKPNTYELELQKRNITACFDKLPDRKATLVGPNQRRHFHAVALACGFSEYFKDPLYLYVKHQLTESSLMHSRTGADAARLGNQPSRPARLTKTSSVDNSTVEKLASQTQLSCDQFLTCWRQIVATSFDLAAQFVHLLTLGQRNYLLPEDFVPLLQSLIDDHPGLDFLRAAPDFHLRYIQTVIARLFYCLNKSWTGKLTLAEVRQSNLLATLELVSRVSDINQVTEYFSYEHFYVIYCKFWTLDTDHDLLISQQDLAKHNDSAISSLIIDRIFMGIVSRHIQQTGKMNYSDFVWFLLAEEDKKHPRAVEYWFRLMDIDGDGYISMYEMEFFYAEQVRRLEQMKIEPLPFQDSACQILDLVNPKEANKISLSDLKRTKMAAIFFDTFINLEKYLEHESCEFASSRDLIQNGKVVSDWVRFASEEYESLVAAEERSV